MRNATLRLAGNIVEVMADLRQWLDHNGCTPLDFSLESDPPDKAGSRSTLRRMRCAASSSANSGPRARTQRRNDELTSLQERVRKSSPAPTDAGPRTGRGVPVYAKRKAIAVRERRELYRSPNGDCWFLGREPQDGRAFVIHQPNGPSGGRLSHIDLGNFSTLRPRGRNTRLSCD